MKVISSLHKFCGLKKVLIFWVYLDIIYLIDGSLANAMVLNMSLTNWSHQVQQGITTSINAKSLPLETESFLSEKYDIPICLIML